MIRLEVLIRHVSQSNTILITFIKGNMEYKARKNYESVTVACTYHNGSANDVVDPFKGNDVITELCRRHSLLTLQNISKVSHVP